MQAFRWGIFLANLDPVIGSEQGKTRPVLVISDEQINQILPVVNVLPITSKKANRTIYPNEVLLEKGIAGLSNESIVLCHQIRTLDKKRLIKKFGMIDSSDLKKQVIETLSFQLGLEK
ncbi:MAG: type II toxin-antitoxin system PemK/MazF family toxin [Deferribacteres bacterium]|nr:type II toxin-antitoxin system PemK/MazF family toxin [candidate division KSB1 bacterium]MCB9504292.1 type II toxin-antitoxin system PemK/MazF family toxin [Deferribacteres bacterium]